MKKRQPSKEEKVAMEIAKLTDSITIDLDQIGKHLARMKPAIFYNRLMIIAEAAEWEMENSGYDQERLF
jgi:hypothetical protein